MRRVDLLSCCAPLQLRIAVSRTRAAAIVAVAAIAVFAIASACAQHLADEGATGALRGRNGGGLPRRHVEFRKLAVL